MRETLLQFVGGLSGVLMIYVSAIAYRAIFGFDPPLGEAAIAGVVSISVGRTIVAGVNDMQVRRATVQYGRAVAPPPTSAPPEG